MSSPVATHPTSALQVLKDDHQTVDDLFTQFEQLGPRAHKARSAVVGRLIEALTVHAAIEEMVFYPAVRKALAGTNAMVLEALEEHHVVKVLLKELEGMPATDERFVAKVTVLAEIVRHHVDEEEKDLFPQVRSAMTRPQLEELGHELLMAKQGVSKRPHPSSPDTPPGNVVAAVIAIPVDAAKNAGEAAVRKVRSLANR
ncbi:MAG: hypothetical protein RJA49_1589 [Actinomycetota bacterium]